MLHFHLPPKHNSSDHLCFLVRNRFLSYVKGHCMDTDDFTSNDFKDTDISTIRYSTEGSGSGSRHGRAKRSTEYECTYYCPTVFRKLLEFANVSYDEYMMSVYEQSFLSEVCDTRKPGVVITRGDGGVFVIKTLHKSEHKVLLQILPKYYKHIKKYRSNSLLIKIFGLHTIKVPGNPKVYFVVLCNVLLSDLQIHGVYDLKGSLQGRDENREVVNLKTIKKDEDLEFCFYLDPSIHQQLLEQLKCDCEFLEDANIMNYSLLLSIHFEALGGGSFNKGSPDDESNSSHKFPESHDNSSPSSLKEHPGSSNPGYKLGTRMPARAVRMQMNEEGNLSEKKKVTPEDSQKVFLNFGIVDIYQSYNMAKLLEHCYKSMQHDPKSISAVNAKAYSTRFVEFITKTFAAEEDT